MADGTSPAEAGGATPSDPGTRGTLHIRDKAVERIAAKAALDTLGVHADAAGSGRLPRRERPRVRVTVSANRVRAAVDIAVPWPRPLTPVAADVRSNVSAALCHLAGMSVDGVDVSVASVLTTVDDKPTNKAGVQ